VWVDGLMVNGAIADEQAVLAAHFLNFAASVTGQTELLVRHLLLPANGAVLVDRYPNVMRMAEQLQSAQLLQDQPWLPVVITLGDAAYRSVLVDGVAPAEAVAVMYGALAADAARYGLTVPTPAPATPPSGATPATETVPPPSTESAPPASQ
jgi:hypothetical protein